MKKVVVKTAKWIIALAVVSYMLMAIWQSYKPLPKGLSQRDALQPAMDVAFLADETWTGADGRRHRDQAIFDEVLRLIAQADRLVVLDMFLFNDFGATADDAFRPLSRQITQALIQRQAAVPGLTAVLITDPINTVYGGVSSSHLKALREAGIEVVMTDLPRLRASNPAWSGFWHLCCRVFGNTNDAGWLPNALGDGRVTLRSYLQLLNFSANHRKILVVDEGEQWTGLVTSANPHDASSLHDNVALRFSGPAALDLLDSERAVADFSGAGEAIPATTDAIFNGAQRERAQEPPSNRERGPVRAQVRAQVRVQVLTESGIRDALLAAVAGSAPGDRLDIAVFYLAHRELIEAVKAASARGVKVRVLLDPNRDAFGIEKNGIPNRPAGRELHAAGVPVRWCNTHGEQCHAKMLLRRPQEGPAELIVGSANFTRRNLDDLNLETSVRLLASSDRPAITAAGAFFEREWSNPRGRRSSLPYAHFADPSWRRYWQYRLMEATGLSTF
ncbi:Phosphatidylserine/phosphatidylglycerophosphate/cardiolipin synthase [Onishia taeanensis]|uniref:Phosphatidylserine/phosphatidylglycerophosphate/cardiolipin synthase n=1 Tax=Onishia taeanensis TaxID=284577 RepID=A0A1G7QP68_9GAMM|nr:phospholipase D family protein [Halomonas taeanensis]SDG00274.1 Phosphatidylserine/phosphatidylglycerophosphate/cardiolipin synthase [Halomonas taeanensis]